MSVSRSILAIARADFFERVRRYSFLVTLLFAVFLGYCAATGRIALHLGDYRGVYTSAWIGALVAVVTTSFVSLVGFYIVKNAIDRDRQTGVGQILAATPLSKLSYALGKFLSNLAVLSAMVVVLALAAVAMQFFAAEDPRLDTVALLAPFLLIALPAMALTAALALLFETLPLLRGGLGNVAWFFVWSILGIGLPELSGKHWLDPMGLITVADSMMEGARANIPGYKDSFSLTIADAPAKIVDTFRWQGVPWTGHMILLRVGWMLAAVVIVLLAALFFDRFNPVTWFFPSAQKAKETSPALVAEQSAAGSIVSVKPPATHLTPLAADAHAGAFGRIFVAELRLALKHLRWWWYAVAAGLLIAQLASPLAISRGPLLGVAWIWPILVWSAMGSRESRFGTRSLLFSCANILPRQLLACFLAGLTVATLTGAGAGVRLLLVRSFAGLFAWFAGAFFLSALALALGTLSGSSKPYEGLLTAIWYVGPMNHTPGLDFTGAASGSHTVSYALIYFALSAALLICSFLIRSRQLRSV
ncbi:MAG: hypothetical protein WBG02_17585 [Candidatus Acidiferrum sp.]